MNEPASIAEQVLSQWGAAVDAIATSEKDESDWLATFPGFRLLVEEKTKLEDPERTRARDEQLAAGKVYGSAVPLTQDNRISGVIQKAAKQLASTGADITHDARIVWFTATGYHAEAKHLQFIATLYGTTRIFELNRPQMRQCYFFRNAQFFRFKDHLDGAVASFLTGDTLTVKLCLNPYSRHWQALRDSPFASHFKVGLIDPVAEEAAGEAYIADTDLPRSDETAVLRYVEQKYKLEMAHTMDMNMASAAIRIPK